LIDHGGAATAIANTPKLRPVSVLIRNTDVQHRPKSQLNLEFQKKLARIQAAGVNGFVKGHRNAVRSEITGEACAEAVVHNSFSNSDRRTEDDG
jgi:hypothetical protein